MKKLYILIFILIGLMNLYGSDVDLIIKKQDFSVFDQNGIVISINDSVDNIIEIFGSVYSIEDVNGMITHSYEGINFNYIEGYDDIISIEFTDNDFYTPRGIKIGMNVEEILKTYGDPDDYVSPINLENDFAVYIEDSLDFVIPDSDGNVISHLAFEIKEDIIISIMMYLIN